MNFLKGLLDWLLGVIAGAILLLVFYQLCELGILPAEVKVVCDGIFNVAQVIVSGVNNIVQMIIGLFTAAA